MIELQILNKINPIIPVKISQHRFSPEEIKSLMNYLLSNKLLEKSTVINKNRVAPTKFYFSNKKLLHIFNPIFNKFFNEIIENRSL